MDYKASKAWHMGHDLAADIRRLVKDIPVDQEIDLAARIHHLAAMTSQQIAESVECNLAHEKIKAYRTARAACKALQEHLSVARDLHYIDNQVYEHLAAKAIMIYRLLTNLIQSGKQTTPGN